MKIVAHKNKILIYTYQIKASVKEDGSLEWAPSEEAIDELFFHMNWQMPVNTYRKRDSFFTGFEIKGNSDIYPILEGKIELDVPSLIAPEFVLEVACTPSKLDVEQKAKVLALIEKYEQDDLFKAWWDSDDKGPDRKPRKNKQRIISILKSKMPEYKGEDDLTPDKCAVTLTEALQFLELGDNLPDEKAFKAQLKKMQLKYHPDRNGGEEEPFKKLQKCKEIISEALADA